MTDGSLLLMENLTYLNEEVASAAGVTLPSITSAENIGKYLDAFDEEALMYDRSGVGSDHPRYESGP